MIKLHNFKPLVEFKKEVQSLKSPNSKICSDSKFIEFVEGKIFSNINPINYNCFNLELKKEINKSVKILTKKLEDIKFPIYFKNSYNRAYLHVANQVSRGSTWYSPSSYGGNFRAIPLDDFLNSDFDHFLNYPTKSQLKKILKNMNIHLTTI